MRRVLIVLALVLTGCGTPPGPEVTFHAAGKTINIEATVECDLRGDNCAQRAENATLKVPPGKVVQISVPGSVADGLWDVTYAYIDTQAGQIVGDQSERLLGGGEDFAYTLKLPRADDQLVRIELHEAGAAILETGVPVPRRSWIIDVVS